MVRSKRGQLNTILISILILGVFFLFYPSMKGAAAFPSGLTTTPTPSKKIASNPIVVSDIYAFAEAPEELVDQPYIILAAFSDLDEGLPLQIAGVVNKDTDFTCQATPCKLALSGDSTVRYWAYAGQVRKSAENSAAVQIKSSTTGQYRVSLADRATRPHTKDSCASVWGVTSTVYPEWTQEIGTPSQLNTNWILYYLGGRLIANGVVDASACAAGGLLSNGTPNACGMERSRAAITDWQNKFDLDIWLAGRTAGIPPRLLKTLLMRESQFWPGNTYFNLHEFGLGQINDFGADVALRWNSDLYLDACQGVLADCRPAYAVRPAAEQAMLRGSLISMVNASCPDCAHGVDMDAAHSSVYVIARVLQANCRETRYILDSHFYLVKNYEDLWKFTLAAYHSGYYCLDYAINSALRAGKPVDWETISDRLACEGAKKYVDDFWTALNGLDQVSLGQTPLRNAHVEVESKSTGR